MASRSLVIPVEPRVARLGKLGANRPVDIERVGLEVLSNIRGGLFITEREFFITFLLLTPLLLVYGWFDVLKSDLGVILPPTCAKRMAYEGWIETGSFMNLKHPSSSRCRRRMACYGYA